MKFIDEFRDPAAVKNLLNLISGLITREWTIMEVCGGQTHTIMRYNLTELLPEKVNLIHGPGCPVCVTPVEKIDKAVEIARRKDVIFTSFGDMLRVPGSELDLLSVKAGGGDVRMVYSPLDAVKIAENNPGKKVVFFGVGFETTAPANAMSVIKADKLNLDNFFLLSSHVLVPPAIKALLTMEDSIIQGFLAAGHVCTVMGYEEYLPISANFKVPIVVTGFEPLDILQGIYMTVKQLEEKRYEVENQYSRAVQREGNPAAKKLLADVFEVSGRHWRGIGEIPDSGFKLSEKYARFDAENIFDVGNIKSEESSICIAGEILKGIKKPPECSAFGRECKPENPLGAPMVSSEGACSAYYRYKKTL